MGSGFDISRIDLAFRRLCTILFGQEVGSLLEFDPYLKEAMLPYQIAKSSFSSEEVFISSPYYKKGARFASPKDLACINAGKISINDIKDVDSLFSAACETLVYCGNKMFGKSHNIAVFDNAIDCIDVYFAHNVRNVKKGAYLSYVRESEYVFGMPAFPKIAYSIRCLEGISASRMFETYYSNYCSDMYYSFNCYNCSEVIFGFNLRGKRHVIGNNALPADKYFKLKKKLISEMAEILSKDKRIFSISDMACLGARESGEEVLQIPTVPAPPSVEKAFSDATRIVLGQERKPIGSYVGWLQKRALPVEQVKGKFGSKAYRPKLPLVGESPSGVLCSRQEAAKENGPLVPEHKLSLPLKLLAEEIAKKMSITMEMVEGESKEVPEVTQAIDSVECWSEWDATSSSRSACSTAAIQSKYIFGGFFRILDSEFCINCYDVVEARRCFEVDSSSKCTDCYFCHNIEGCESCILCSNIKGKRYAVLNQEVGKEEFLRIKKMLLDYINKELDSKNGTEKSIFSL
jgi:hypothetical protein